LLLGYNPVQHVTVLNTVGSCNTMILLYYNFMGPPSLTETSLCGAYLYTEWPFISLPCCCPRFLFDKMNFGTLYLCNDVGLYAFFCGGG
jgi:hypothetical protein